MKCIPNSTNYTKIIFILFTIIILGITLFPLIYLAFYNHPCLWDDYLVFSNLPHNRISTFKYGIRYATRIFNFTFLYPSIDYFDLNTMKAILNIYHLFSIIYIVLTSLSFFYFLFEVNKNVLKFSKTIFFCLYSISLFLLFNFINASPELLYCHTVTTGYTGGIIFMFLFLGMIVKYYYSITKKEITFSFSLLFLITFILSGYIEFFVLFAGYIAFYLFLFINKRNTKKRDILFFFLFVFCIFIFASFFVVNYFNTKSISIVAKYANETENQSPLFSFLKRIPEWAYYTRIFIWQDIKKFFSPFNFPIILLLFIIIRETYKITFSWKTFLFFLFLYPVILLMSLSGSYSGLAWFSIYSYPRNVFDVLFFVISIPFFYIVFTVIIDNLESQFLLKLNISEKTKQLLFNFFSIIVCISTLFSCLFSNRYLLGIAWHDVISGGAKSFNAIQLDNYKNIFSASNDETIHVTFPGYYKSIVTHQGNSILYDPTTNSLCASKDVLKFFNKKKIIYDYDESSPNVSSYIQLKKPEGENLLLYDYFD